MTDQHAAGTGAKHRGGDDAGNMPESYPADPGRTLDPEPSPEQDAFAEPEHWVGRRRPSRPD